MLEIIFAILAGILTVGAPCILPMIPILLGSSINSSKTKPLFIALGFATTFAIVGLTLSYLTTTLNLDPTLLRTIASFLLVLFGLFMLWPSPFEKLAGHLSQFSTKATTLSQKLGTGNLNGFVLGITLGIIWTPCAGPVLGSILTLVATQTNLSTAGILLLAYAIGASIPMLLVAYGGQYATNKIKAIVPYTKRIQQFFGLIIMIMAILIYFNYDTLLQAKILEFYNYSSLESSLLKSSK